jgi:hypothetical protein
MPDSHLRQGEDAELRRDDQGQVWSLHRGPFRNWKDEEVVQATPGPEQDGAVQRYLHIPLVEWEAWEVVR